MMAKGAATGGAPGMGGRVPSVDASGAGVAGIGVAGAGVVTGGAATTAAAADDAPAAGAPAPAGLLGTSAGLGGFCGCCARAGHATAARPNAAAQASVAHLDVGRCESIGVKFAGKFADQAPIICNRRCKVRRWYLGHRLHNAREDSRNRRNRTA
jgi:hypothetical protein